MGGRPRPARVRACRATLPPPQEGLAQLARARAGAAARHRAALVLPSLRANLHPLILMPYPSLVPRMLTSTNQRNLLDQGHQYRKRVLARSVELFCPPLENPRSHRSLHSSISVTMDVHCNVGQPEAFDDGPPALPINATRT